MTEPEEGRSRKVSTWIRAIGKLRDGLLILATATYVLGYVVWSVNARLENLGLLPALEPQYLVAGVIPTLLLWLAYVGFKTARKLPEKVVKWRDQQTGTWPMVWRTVGFLCVAIALLPAYIMRIIIGKYGIAWTISLSILTPVLLVTGLLLLLRSPKEEGSAEPKRGVGWLFFPRASPSGVRFLMYSYLTIYLAGLGALYVFVIYPNLPQEFGGVRPRCAYVDVVKDQVSESVRMEILPATATESKGAVVQSLRVQVFFSGTEFMLIKPYDKSKLFELRKPIIQAIHWCDSTGNRN